MSLTYVLLVSLLVDGSQSGYELAKSFNERADSCWTASHQQIYRELKQLEKSGWVCSETVSQGQRPAKNVYSITKLGRESLSQWALKPSQMAGIREELLAKVKIGFLIPQELLMVELERQYQLHLDRLHELKKIEEQRFSKVRTHGIHALSLSERLNYLVLSRGIRSELEWVDWCTEAIRIVEGKQL
jgi:DNA-binding PadR family transcriptional regulator